MKTAKAIREAMHAVACASDHCGRFNPDHVPEDVRAQAAENAKRYSAEHARIFAGDAREFRKAATLEEAETAFHDAVCMRHGECPAGRRHLRDEHRSIVRDLFENR